MSCHQTQQQKFVNWQGDCEVRGEDFTAAVTLGNPDVLVGSGKLCEGRYFVILKCTTNCNFILSLSFSLTTSSFRYYCSTLHPVHNPIPGFGRGAGLPSQARRGRHSHVSSWQIHRWGIGHSHTEVWEQPSLCATLSISGVNVYSKPCKGLCTLITIYQQETIK